MSSGAEQTSEVPPPAFAAGTPTSISEAFSRIVRSYPSNAAIMAKNERGIYRTTTYQELDRLVSALAISLRQLGIAKGDRVAIIAYHGVEWVISDLAVLKLGGIIVPIYHTLSASQAKYIISDSGSKLVMVENSQLYRMVDSMRGELSSLAAIVVFNTRGIEEQGPLTAFWDLIHQGKRAWAQSPPGTEALPSDVRFPSVATNDTATIVYTSGTTGEPKGVVLSHMNILSNAFASIDRFSVTSGDVFLSFLPLCHMLEKTGGYYTHLLAGATIAYGGDVTTIARDVQEIKPTTLIVVPRILEKIHDIVRSEVLRSSPFQQGLVHSAIRSLNERANLKYKNLSVPIFLRLKCRFYDSLIASRFRRLTGGRLRVLISGGAPLEPSLAKTLHILGFNIYQGYGLTETSPCVSTTMPKDNRLGTVGKPYDNVEVRIGENDEILVRGPNVMKCYFNKPKETAEVIDSQGWFHTGDQGRFDEQGNLVITGRIKELIVTSYGKNIVPGPIESEIAKSDYIEQVVLYGDNQKYLVALIVPQRQTIESYARENSLAAADYCELLKKQEIRDLIETEIEKATNHLSSFEKVKALALIAESFTVENELLTPTLKTRRTEVWKRYHDLIDSLYSGSG